MKNVDEVEDCYGCGVCVIACGIKIIDIRLNGSGFYEPSITNKDACTECGVCMDVCAYLHNTLSVENSVINSYAAWSMDEAVRKKSSSGGVGFELARTLLKNDYKVCGVRYNANLSRAEHYVASTLEDLVPSMGSKYIQSYTIDGFKSIDRKKKNLVVGTPCQIDSFRRYIKKNKTEDNFVLMDFFCHGVPSMLLWKKYVSEVERITGKITYASWRNKFTGWHDSWAMSMDGELNGEKNEWHDSFHMLIKEKTSYYNSRLSQGDTFYNLFLSDSCLGKACYAKCKYKYNNSSADIRIGDLWGETYKLDENGVSAVITFTNRGDKLLHSCNCNLKEHIFQVVVEGQMKNNPVEPLIRRWVLRRLCSVHSLRSTLNIYRLYRLPKRIINKLLRMLR